MRRCATSSCISTASLSPTRPMERAEPKPAPSGIASAGDGLAADYSSAWPVILRLLRECMLPNWKIVLVGILAMTVTAATAGALPFLIQKLGDDVFVGRDATLLFALPALVLLVMLLRAAADWVATVTESSLGTKIVADLRVRMFDTMAAADLAWLQRTHSGRFVSAFVNDALIVDRAATKVLTALFKNALSVVLLVGAMVYMDWRLSLLV